MATIKDVAERAGVTVTTVSRMLNDRVRISPKTRGKICAAMEELDYRPNELARSLSKQSNNMIGLIVASASNYFFCKVINSVERFASQYGYKLLLCVSNHEPQKEIEYFRMLKANKVAGVILASHTQSLEEHLNFDAPIISFDRMLSNRISSVCSDNYRGGELAAQHLLEKGCKTPALFSDVALEGMYSNLRCAGFTDAMKMHGIRPVTYYVTSERFISMEYEDCIDGFFNANTNIDGIFCSNDIIAAQILRYCNKRDIRVPGQIKVVGFDGIDLAGFCSPALTTIRQPVDDNCRFAVEYIANFNATTIPANTVFPVQLVLGEST